jgi:predicted ATPase
MLVTGISVEHALIEDDARDQWPYTVPCVAALARDGMELTSPVTFLVGENGSGKSTLVEAIAEAAGLDARGGRAGRKYVNDREKTPLGKVMRLAYTREALKTLVGPRAKRRGFFLRAETFFGLAGVVSGMPGYWVENLDEQSHGEGFRTVFEAMFAEPGLYLLDEPEAALSFGSCLYLVALMHELSKTGAQVICATHSPILASTPGADIIEVGPYGFRRAEWAELDLVDHWRRYLGNPEVYLRRLID